MIRRFLPVAGVAIAGAVSQIRHAGANPDFPNGHDCQHNDQCRKGCCKNGECKRPKRCKNNGGTP